MLAWDLFLHYLLGRRAGSLTRVITRLCLLGTGVAMFALVLVVSIMNGFHHNIHLKLLAVEPHIVVERPGSSDQPDRALEAARALLPSQHIEDVSEFESQDVIVRTVDGLFAGGLATGLTSQSLQEMMVRASTFGGGRRLSPESLQLAPGEVAMGWMLARSLGILEGDIVTLLPPESLLLPAGEIPNYEKVTVKTILETEIQDIDSQVIFYDLGQSLSRLRQTASRQAGWNFRLSDPYRVEAITPALEKMGIKSQTWVSRNSLLFFALRMEKYVMLVFLGLSALITSFSIVTVLSLLIVQKQQDIAILMAMGATGRQVMLVFTQIGLVLAAVGMGVGAFLGMVASLLLQAFPLYILPDIYYDSSLPARVDWGVITGALVVAVAIAAVASWLPTRSLSNVQPAELLRRR